LVDTAPGLRRARVCRGRLEADRRSGPLGGAGRRREEAGGRPRGIARRPGRSPGLRGEFRASVPWRS